ncbi:mismatch-specific DNA-glycosylase [Aquipuribacter nitratireducens]|uniref:mismatch-specific DNA-glycosylase n=1 Tax=Aquipuribacter nitratireducens TaxID=650104 RepID=UPI003BEF2E6B
MWSGWSGHHFARPGNRFWPALHASGFTPRRLDPGEEQEVLGLGLGITNVVARATAAAADLTDDELRAGRHELERKVLAHAPRTLAVLGITAYRTAFGRPRAALGEQPDHVIGTTRVWVLPNPSGLNAHHTPADLARLFATLREAVQPPHG